ncbi:MAG: ABC transporter ATP-binding protein [Deferrisomatales bacterium]
MLRLADVTKVYRAADGREVAAVVDLSLRVAEGQFVSIVGTSGCGKTTTLRLIAGLERPTRGAITLDGRPIEGPSRERTVVFQRYTLFPWRTVLDNVTFGLDVAGCRPRVERVALARRYLAMVRLAGFEGAYPHELSGGMQQRVAVARALAANPRVLLMDEPFGALDAQTRISLQGELLRIWEEERKTVLFVTHSIDEAVYLSDRVVVMGNTGGRAAAVVDIRLPRPREPHSELFRQYYAYIRSRLVGDGARRTKGVAHA